MIKHGKAFDRRATLVALMLCVLPLVIRIVLNCIYVYEIEGNIAYSGTLGVGITYCAELLGRISFFSAFGIAVCVSAVYGMKRGGEWLIGIAAMYGVSYLLLVAVDSYVFGVIAYLVCAAATVTALCLWIKGGARVYATVCAGLFLSVVGGLATVFATGSINTAKLLYYCFYGLINFGFELVLVLLACRMCVFMMRSKTELPLISGRLVSLKNPILCSLLTLNTVFALIITVEPTIGVVESLMEYGAPVNTAEWVDLISVYGRLVLLFLLGYTVMRISAGLTEGAYIRSRED